MTRATVTLLQGLVLARSAFEHSANYESVVAFGRFRPIEDADEWLAALAAFTNKLLSRPLGPRFERQTQRS